MRALKTAWKHIRRTPYQALAAILIITQAFIVISVFTFVILGSAKIISYFESKPQVIAFFKDEAKQEDIDSLKESIQATGKVSKIKFVSKQEALKIYQQQNRDNPLLLDLVTADYLPASLDISTTKIEDLSGIFDLLKSSSIVKEVAFQKDIVATLTSWTNAIRKIGLALIFVLALDSIAIMVIIIGIKIANRREEIEIMRLLGASSWYVRWPFLYEGIFYGLCGSLIGWVVASGSLLYFTPFLVSFLGNIPLLPVSPVFLLELLGVELCLAIVLGTVASFIAVFRYLK